MPDAQHRREIFCIERDGLLYRMYFREDGEVAFTVAGDTLAWAWCPGRTWHGTAVSTCRLTAKPPRW